MRDCRQGGRKEGREGGGGGGGKREEEGEGRRGTVNGYRVGGLASIDY